MGNFRPRSAVFIYLIAVTPCGPVKIGRAANPHVRFDQVQTANHLELTLVGVCELSYAAAIGAEKQLHQHFKAQRVRGEWFAVSVGDAMRQLAKHGRVDTNLKRLKPVHRTGANPETALLDAQLCHPRLRSS